MPLCFLWGALLWAEQTGPQLLLTHFAFRPFTIFTALSKLVLCPSHAVEPKSVPRAQGEAASLWSRAEQSLTQLAVVVIMPVTPSWHGREDVTPLHPLRPTPRRTSQHRVRTEKQSQRREVRSASQLGPVRRRRKSPWLAVSQQHCEHAHSHSRHLHPTRARCTSWSGFRLCVSTASPCAAGKWTRKASADGDSNPQVLWAWGRQEGVEPCKRE